MPNWRQAVVPVAASVATLAVLIGFFAAGFQARGWWDRRGAVPVAAASLPGEKIVPNVSADDDPYWGPKDALVTVVEFADFQCPFCRRHAQETLPQLKERYGDKVRYVFRDFPIVDLHPASYASAEAAQCAFAQGGFWPFHELLFKKPEMPTRVDFMRYAAKAGLNAAAFKICVESRHFKDEVKADMDAGVAYGITGTPTFFVNGREIDGAASFSEFSRIIDEELKKSAASGH